MHVARCVSYINLQPISEGAKVAAQIVRVLGRAQGGIQNYLESDGEVHNTYWLLNEAPSIHGRMKSCFVSIMGTIRDCPATPKDRQECAKHSDMPTEAPGSAGDFRSSQRLPVKHHHAPQASSVFLMLRRKLYECLGEPEEVYRSAWRVTEEYVTLIGC